MRLSLVAAAVIVGDRAILGVGIWSSVLFCGYLASVWIISRTPGRTPWVVDGAGREGPKWRPPGHEDDDEERGPLSKLALKTALGGLAILGAGILLSKTGEAISAETGLGQSLGGYLLVAVSTSLPEVSTVVASVRLGRYVMAVSDIFGTNLFNCALVFVVDVVYRGGPVPNEVGDFSAVAAALGVIVSALFLAGLAERRDRTLFRMGYDSIAVLVVYLAGVGVLFTLR